MRADGDVLCVRADDVVCVSLRRLNYFNDDALCAAPQPLQGTGAAIAVPRRLCEVVLKFVEHLIGVPEGPTPRRLGG